VDGAVFLVIGDDTLADAVLHNQIGSEELNEILGVVSQRLSIKSVQQSVSSPVGGSTAAVCLSTLSILLRLTTESALVATFVSATASFTVGSLHLAVVRSGERTSIVFEFNDGLRSLAGHVMDSILVTEPI
jgi:hypothetical protein